jgi:hypothetical protein
MSIDLIRCADDVHQTKNSVRPVKCNNIDDMLTHIESINHHKTVK